MSIVVKVDSHVIADAKGLSQGKIRSLVGKIARTIVDLGNSTDIKSNHVLEAIQYRPKVV